VPDASKRAFLDDAKLIERLRARGSAALAGTQ
jgi:hypothetical protein